MPADNPQSADGAPRAAREAGQSRGVTGMLETQVACIDAARAGLASAQDDLAAIRVRAGALAHATAWQSPAAAAFREAVQAWQHGIALADGRIDRLRDDLQRTRDLLTAQAGPGP